MAVAVAVAADVGGRSRGGGGLRVIEGLFYRLRVTDDDTGLRGFPHCARSRRRRRRRPRKRPRPRPRARRAAGRSRPRQHILHRLRRRQHRVLLPGGNKWLPRTANDEISLMMRSGLRDQGVEERGGGASDDASYEPSEPYIYGDHRQSPSHHHTRTPERLRCGATIS